MDYPIMFKLLLEIMVSMFRQKFPMAGRQEGQVVARRHGREK
jgi:hypothetical protein